MADKIFPLGDGVSFERYKDMGDGTFAKVVSIASDLRSANSLIAKPSKPMFNFADPNVSVGLSNITGTLVQTWQRYSGYTRQLAITGNSATVFKTNQALTADPVDQLIDIHIYLPDVPSTGASGQSINVTLSNANSTTNNNIYSFNSNYLKQGWNILRCWGGETIGTVDDGTAEATTCIGSGRSVAGTGMDWTAAINYIEVAFNNFSGRNVYICSARRGHKVKSVLVMGFDATSNGSTDFVFTNKVAPLFAQYGYKGYFTCTWIYDFLYAGSAIEAVKPTLYNTYGWDAINHTYDHGATVPGFTKVGGVTGSRTSNLVTITWTGHGYPVGSKFWTSVAGASPSDANGIFEFTAASVNTLTYTAAGADGALTGTITLDSRLEKVLVDSSATSLAIARHEIQDIQRLMQGYGYTRAIHIGAWPNNSAPELGLTKTVCDEVGIKLFRGIRGGTVKFSDFGLTSPLNFGSVEMGSSGGASGGTSLLCLGLKLQGAIGRGEHLWTYGHFILDELDPANSAHANANTDYPPGNHSNPNPPSSGQVIVGSTIGGWWYLGTLSKFFSQYVKPAVDAGNLQVMSASEWAKNVGYGK